MRNDHTITLVGEAWGEHEDAMQHPFVGPSGSLLMDLLSDVGLLTLTSADRANRREWFRYKNPYFNKLVWEAHPEIRLLNVFNLRPRPSNDVSNLCGPKSGGIPGMPMLSSGKYVKAEHAPHVEKLWADLGAPNCVVALGGTAAWALCRTSGIRKIRGAPLLGRDNVKVVPTYHPAAVMREWGLRPIVIADLEKAKRENAYPEIRRPEREIWVEPSLQDLLRFEREHIDGARFISADIETKGDQITCIGFAPSRGAAIVVPFYDPTKSDGNYWPSLREELLAWAWVRHVCGLPKQFVFQNGCYDLHFLLRRYGITVPQATEDTMLLHHALQPEMEKGLGFLGSVYTNEASWKFMRNSDTVKRED